MQDVITPEQASKAADKAYQTGNFLGASDSFETARRGYRAAGNSIMAAEMANNRSVALLRANEPEAALAVLEGTAEIFSEADDKNRLALAWGNEAAALEALGRLEEAEECYWKSSELLKELGENDLRLYTMQAISAVQLRTKRQLQAIATMQAGVAGIEKPGPRHRLLRRILDIPGKILNR